MKIIKQGIKTQNFICEHCGCEFTADETEYNVSSCTEMTGRIYYNTEKLCDMAEEIKTTHYKCNCPCCGKFVYNETKERV